MTTSNDMGRITFGPQEDVLMVPAGPSAEEYAAQQASHAEKQAEVEREAARLVRREQLHAMARSWLSTTFELLGMAGLSVAGFFYAVWLGVTIGSLGLIIVGVAIDPPVWRFRVRDDDDGPGAEEGP